MSAGYRVTSRRNNGIERRPVSVRRPHSSPMSDRVAELGIVGDDATLDLVADLSADIDWDEAAEAGLSIHEGAADKAVTQLTDDERVELRRLLQAELRRQGD